VNALLHYWEPIESMCSISDAALHVIIDSNYMITRYKACLNYIWDDIRLAARCIFNHYEAHTDLQMRNPRSRAIYTIAIYSTSH
jgi:hypothetical protein